MKDLEIYEVIKEFEFFIGFDSLIKLKGKILKVIEPELSDRYIWRISHHCKPHEDAIGVYKPSSASHNSSVESAESNLLNYVKGFKNIDIKENEFF